MAPDFDTSSKLSRIAKGLTVASKKEGMANKIVHESTLLTIKLISHELICTKNAFLDIFMARIAMAATDRIIPSAFVE